jgi:hypothetical protein
MTPTVWCANDPPSEFIRISFVRRPSQRIPQMEAYSEFVPHPNDVARAKQAPSPSPSLPPRDTTWSDNYHDLLVELAQGRHEVGDHLYDDLQRLERDFADVRFSRSRIRGGISMEGNQRDRGRRRRKRGDG